MWCGHSWARPFLEEGVGRQLASASCREGKFPWALQFPRVELSVPRGKASNRDQPFLKQGSSPTSHLGLTSTSALPGNCGRHWLPLAVFSFPTSQDSEVMGVGTARLVAASAALWLLSFSSLASRRAPHNCQY